ncbi:hypothetical protein CC86DRAFT_81114 [Ophiobolus disseminans]|uniref:Heterokaryon incompatibility domain-containing protein n=1 Tax=Ophiobolus disseminans TaxID=1469910 RepID=A0A6A6ZPY0_9PLEO|nr:hypothetical protein CC86DRAFT_81114 [Ophiobolus disseminans]
MKRVNAFLNRSVPGKPELSPAPTENRAFEYKPLDETQSSLRLVTISSELSADGCIQCYLSHSTLDRASYVCASYRWGPPGDVRIHINGAPFYVRKNLFDFLDLIRNMPMTFYWIDAICIDQQNIPERNHQIKQMGQIYSRAFLVYSWLGKMPSMAPFVTHLRAGSQWLHGQTGLPRNTIIQARDTVRSCVFNNEYWNRAWVTPEVVLARSVLILVGREPFKLPDLVQAMNNFEHPDLLSGFSDCAFAQFVAMVNTNKPRTRTLIHLIDDLRDRECIIPRDRIYSLLPLCCDFQHPQVDYNQPSEDLAFDVLKRSDELLCTCSALLIAQTLFLVDHDEQSDIHADTMIYIEFDIKGLRFDRHAMLCNDQIYSWGHYKLIGTDMFGHDELFPDFCPAFATLMDALQAQAIEMSVDTPHFENNLVPSPAATTPFLLRMMDEEHVQGMLNGFGKALTITSHDSQSDTSTVRVALWLLSELIPRTIPLCSKSAHRKEKGKDSDENASTHDQDGLAHRSMSMSMERRGTEIYWGQNLDVRRIDSAGPLRHPEDEGPISRLRLVKCPIVTSP